MSQRTCSWRRQHLLLNTTPVVDYMRANPSPPYYGQILSPRPSSPSSPLFAPRGCLGTMCSSVAILSSSPIKLLDDADANIPAITQQEGRRRWEHQTPLVIWQSHAFTELATGGHATYCTEPQRSTHLPSTSGIERGLCQRDAVLFAWSFNGLSWYQDLTSWVSLLVLINKSAHRSTKT